MSTKTTELIVSKTNLLKGLDQALQNYKVVALTHRGERVLYDYISSTNEIELHCNATVLPLKKYFFPQDETIVEYTADGKFIAKAEAKPTVLFGIHPCDINGLKILTEAFADDHGDPNYLAKRELAVVIGVECAKLCDKDAFCSKVNTHYATAGYDLMLYPQADQFALEIATEKGREFVAKYFSTEKAKGDEIAHFCQEKDANFAAEPPFKDLEKFPELFEANKLHPIWDQEGARCLSCGSCIMVCPTCFCFDVKDEWQLNLEKGRRIRKWDACMLNDFTKVAGGEIFRHTATKRLHHRINRKFDYLMSKHKMAVCVGCGRCVRACLADISPRTIAEAINGEKPIK